MHLTLIGLFLYLFLYWLLRRSEYLILIFPVRKLAILLSLPPLLCYSFLAGLGSPAVRACIMALVVGFAFCTDRVKSTPNLLSLAAVTLLVVSPQKLFTASFQLSFTAVASIAIFAPLIRDIHNSSNPKEGSLFQITYRGIVAWIITGILVSSAAVAGTAPLILYHFNRFPIAGPITNLLVEPLICFFALPLGFLSLIFMEMLPQLSVFLLQIGGSFITIANSITAWISALPYTEVWLPQPSCLNILCYYTLLLFTPILILLGCAGRAAALLLFTISLAVLLVPDLLRLTRVQPLPTITFLDVGQGSATIIRTRDGKALLIDGGGSSSLSPSVGERIIAPYLWKMGVTKLHGIIITHPDADHYNGLPFLICHFSPEFVWTSTLSETEPGYRQLLKLCSKRKIPVHLVQQGEQIEYGDTTVTCLVNSRRPPYNCENSNSGLVLQVQLNALTILFPGDIEKEVEQQIVEHDTPLQSDIILAPHHGSATSSSRKFINTVNPSTIIVSAGKSRKNIYPSEKLLSYCQQNDVALYATHTDGAIWVEVDNKKKKLYRFGDMQANPLLRPPQDRIAEQEFD
ncbi:DNA internalization-related competence protein ComEC/Rec2 [Desulfopila sp. IMCC35008]|uniref:DNA internalization-related competence protein ComEC/Rec2 n=1 Tax=Desulfopila sp. IMCC35008 TaxID=2653858 RepID=UPI0013D48BA2|nr:DNA internalization-related competence protein ComEC/Rec2 [Desulfopila sp. IMCC35008]